MASSPINSSPHPTIAGLRASMPHSDAAREARTDLTGGGAGAIRTETLPNGARLIVAERPGAHSVKVQVGVAAGALEDPPGRLGLAHLLEHLSFEGSPTRPATVQERIRNGAGGQWNAYTSTDRTVYYGVVPNRDARTATALLTDMVQHPETVGRRVAQEKAAVDNEMIFWNGGSISGVLGSIADKLVHGDHPLTNNVIGSRATVARMTGADLRDFHDRYYVGRNAVALVEGDPKHLPLATLRRELGRLEPGARVDHGGLKQPFRAGQQMQLVRDDNAGAVSLGVSLPVPKEALDAVKDPLTRRFVASALGERLGDVLRRNHHLTYGVLVSLDPSQAADGAVLSIDTKVAPEHQQAAMRDIVATLTDARDGFGDATFAVLKRAATSRLAMREATPAATVSERAEDAFQGALDAPGVTIPPATQDAAAKAADAKAAWRFARITPAQFAKAAATLIDLSQMKVLAYGPVGDGARLRAGAREAGVTRRFELNPVDLREFADMGLRPVPPAS